MKKIAAAIIFSFLFCASFAFVYAKGSDSSDVITISKEDFHPKVALALSGGGARGLSQIGIVEVLKNEGVELDCVVGTSVGALIGGMLAVGYEPEELDSLVRALDWDEIFSSSDAERRKVLFWDQKQIHDRSIVTLRFKKFKFVVPPAIAEDASFRRFLQETLYAGDYSCANDFDNLKYPFRAVATDLASAKAVAFDSGSLPEVLRASSTIPIRTPPVRIDSGIYVDGGLTANIPTEIALSEFSPDLIIAADAVSPLYDKDELDKPWIQADQALTLMMKRFSDSAAAKADFVIRPDIGDYPNTDFSDSEFLISKGKEATISEIVAIKRKISELKAERIEKFVANFSEYSKYKLSNFYPEDSAKIANTIVTENASATLRLLASSLTEKYESISLKRIEAGDSIVLTAKRYPKFNRFGLNCSNSELEAEISKFAEDSVIGKNFTTDLKKEFSVGCKRILRNFGYDFGSVSLTEAQDSLCIKVNLGLLCEIKISGEKTIDEFLIAREIPVNPGDVLTAKSVIQGLDNLNATGLFSRVYTECVRLESGNIDLIVEVEEAGTQIVRIGGRVDNERNSQIGADLIQENAFNIGDRLTLRGSGGSKNQSASVSYDLPRFLKTLALFNIKAYYDDRNIYKFREKNFDDQFRWERERIGVISTRRIGAIAGIGYQIERSGKLFAEVRYEKQRYYDTSAPEIPDYYDIKTAKFGAIFDSEDRAYFPREGSYAEMSLETTIFQSQSERSFSKAELQYRLNNSFGPHTFQYSAFFGFADVTAPFPEFYSMGGQDIFFGLREDEERGRQMILNSVGYRVLSPYSLFFDTYFSLRYDVGSIWEKIENAKFSNFKHGVGASLEFDTPLGPARFAFGQSFYFVKDPAGVARGPLRFYYEIGIKL